MAPFWDQRISVELREPILTRWMEDKRDYWAKEVALMMRRLSGKLEDGVVHAEMECAHAVDVCVCDDPGFPPKFEGSSSRKKSSHLTKE